MAEAEPATQEPTAQGDDGAPTQAMPKATTPVSHLTLGDIPLEHLAYIRFRQQPATRREIRASDIIAVYYDSALDMDEEMPAIPTAGVGLGVGNFGPFDIYMHVDCANAFAAKFAQLEVSGSMLDISSIRAMDRTSVPDNATTMGISITPYLTDEGGYLDVKYPAGAAFQVVHKNDIIATLRTMGINVFRGARLQVKMQGEDGEAIPMGKTLMTDRVNLVVKPMHGDFASFRWPPVIQVYNEKMDKTYDFKYRLGGKNAVDLHSDYDGCKGPVAECMEGCSISGYAAREPASSERGAPKRKAAADAEERKERGQQGVELFLAGRTKKNEKACPHFGSGKCQSGTKCGFMHFGGNDQRDGSANSTWESIQCTNDRHLSGWCKAAPNCVYTPCAERQRAAKAKAMDEDKEMDAEEKNQRERGTHPPLYQ